MPLKSHIPRIRARLTSTTAGAIYRAAGYVQKLARQFAPVDSGAWRDSIVLVPDSPALTVTVEAGGPAAPHGILVEYGDPSNPNYPAQPTITPAAAAIRPEQEVSKDLQTLFRKESL